MWSWKSRRFNHIFQFFGSLPVIVGIKGTSPALPPTTFVNTIWTFDGSHVGDIGTIFETELLDEYSQPLDPSTATILTIYFKLPNSVILTRSASVSTSGVGQKQKWFLSYTITPSDLSTGLLQSPGLLYLQGVVIFQNGDTYHTNIVSNLINPNLF